MKSLRQVEARTEGEQHRRARTDSDRYSAHIALQGEKKKKDFSSLKCKCEVKLHCFCSFSYPDVLLSCSDAISVN